MGEIVIFAALFLGIFFGAAAAWLFGKERAKLAVQSAVVACEQPLRSEMAALREQLAVASTRLQESSKAHAEKLEALDAAKSELTVRFKTLSQEIFDEKTKAMREQNVQTLSALLTPLDKSITEFKTRLEQTHTEDAVQRAALSAQIKHLGELSGALGVEAKQLSRALVGESKTQGNWGEMILQRVLDSSGLVEGREYETQSSFKDEDGARAIPDVLLHLPDGRHIVIDSKVSLVAYTKYSNAQDAATRAEALKEHLASMERHISQLSTKNYHQLYSLQTLDFVVMFVPIEPAYTLTLQQKEEFFAVCGAKNIVPATPTTLFAILKSIAFVWRQELQNQNALAIAQQAGKMLDKFAAFAEDIEKLGRAIQTSQSAYNDAYGKLVNGRGNIIGQLQKIESMGAKAAKKLPPAMLSSVVDDEAQES